MRSLIIALACLAACVVQAAERSDPRIDKLHAIQGLVQDSRPADDIKKAVEMALALRGADPHVPVKLVASLDPMWISRQLNERALEGGAALSICGGAGVFSCDDAATFLRHIMSKCTRVFLGIIDLEEHPGTPLNLYDTKDSRLILLQKRDADAKYLAPFTLKIPLSPENIAIAMCPAESSTFGHALRTLNFGR